MMNEWIEGARLVLEQTMSLGPREKVMVIHHESKSNMAKAFATCVVLFWNFGVNRVWTYRGIE